MPRKDDSAATAANNVTSITSGKALSTVRPWEGSSIRLEEFYNSASDNKGHNTRLQTLAPPGVKRDIELILSSKKFPYESAADLIRHAVVEHLRRLHEVEPLIQRGVLTALEMMQELAKDEQFDIQVQDTFDQFRQLITNLIERADHAGVTRTVALARTFLINQRESRWKDKMLADFNTQYLRYLA